MDKNLEKSLKTTALKIRIGILEELKNLGFGHVGGSLSVADALAVLYSTQMKFDPKNPKMPDRDKLICSKGHAGPAVYSTLAHFGFFPEEMLKTLNAEHTLLPSHCDRTKTPGVDMTTGSLGQGTSLACGMALGDKLLGYTNRVFLIVGDGEANEGQVWEAFEFAAAKKLDNLVVLLDVNGKQLDGPTKEILDPKDYTKKMEAFGFDTQTIDGNNVKELYKALEKTRKADGKPFAIIMNTIKGKGVKAVEETASNHSMNKPFEQWKEWQDQLIKELGEEE